LDTRGASNMRLLKIICACFFAVSVASIIRGIHEFYLARAASEWMRRDILYLGLSLADAIFWGCAWYGIQVKAALAWKLGWFVAIVGLSEFIIRGVSSTSRIPDPEHPLIASAAVIVVALIVGIYWCFWWKGQKSYFVSRLSSDAPSQRIG
jgi:hypothetical protein